MQVYGSCDVYLIDAQIHVKYLEKGKDNWGVIKVWQGVFQQKEEAFELFLFCVRFMVVTMKLHMLDNLV